MVSAVMQLGVDMFFDDADSFSLEFKPCYTQTVERFLYVIEFRLQPSRSSPQVIMQMIEYSRMCRVCCVQEIWNVFIMLDSNVIYRDVNVGFQSRLEEKFFSVGAIDISLLFRIFKL